MHKSLLGFFAVLALAPTLGAVEDHDYLGINNGTGFNTAPDYVAHSVATTKALGFGSARVGMDGVGGEEKGAAFRWGGRDATVDAYLKAGLEVRTVVTPRGQIKHGANSEQWQANWEYFVRGVMEHYRGRLHYYIIDNEPELSFGQGTLDAAQAIVFTRIAWKVSREIDPSIRIESPPSNSPESDILRAMLEGGIAQYCDYIGTHLYGAQTNDGRAGKPWTWMKQYGVHKPLSASETGVTPRWVPKGFEGGGEEWRRRWLPQYYLSLKRYGYVHSMLFSLTDGENGWEFYNGKFEPNYTPTAQELKDGFRVRPFANGNFEAPNDREREWQEPYDPDRAVPPKLIDFHAGGAHAGQACASFDIGGANAGQPVIARRIAANLRPGAVYRLDAWVKITGATGRAHLKALGFDTLDGDRSVAFDAAPQNGGWQTVSLTVRPRASWLVVELGADGTGKPGDNVRWDDVTLTETAAPTRPDAPHTLQTLVRPDEAMLTWDTGEGATHFRVKRAEAANGPFTVIFDQVTGSPWTDVNLKPDMAYFYKVSAVNPIGESGDSPVATARTASGSITAEKALVTGPVDLTAEGSLDWVHWGEGGARNVDRKVAGTSPAGIISDYKAYSAVQSFGDLPFRFSWTDGTNGSGSSSNGVYVFFPGSGLHLSVPADETRRTLKVYVGAFNARGKLVARLSDRSLPEYRDASFVSEPKGKFNAVYTLTYRAANPGQRLEVAWVEDSSLPGAEGNVQLQAATLAPAGK